MKLTPPKAVTFWISVILVVLGALAPSMGIPVIKDYSMLVVLIGFVLLALGNLVKGF